MDKIQLAALDFCKANGFDSKGVTYVIFDKNSYEIKDELKKKGCKYSKLLGWHSPVDLPEYNTHQFLLAELYHYEKATGRIVQKEDAEALVASQRRQAFPPAPSQEYDKDVVDHLEVTLVDFNKFRGKYGMTGVYTFMDDDLHYFVYFTSRDLGVEINDVFLISGEIKEKKIYKDIHQTVLVDVEVYNEDNESN